MSSTDMQEKFKQYVLPNLGKPWVLVVIGVILVGGIWFFFGREEVSPYEIVIAERKDIVSGVSVSGSVKPAAAFDLAFEKTGRVSRVLPVGTVVTAGMTLAALDNLDALSLLNQAQAQAKAKQANLDELTRGTRPEEISIDKAKVAQAQSLVSEGKQGLLSTIKDGYTKADDAIRYKSDQLFSNPRTASPDLNISSADSQLVQDVESSRIIVESLLISWNT